MSTKTKEEAATGAGGEVMADTVAQFLKDGMEALSDASDLIGRMQARQPAVNWSLGSTYAKLSKAQAGLRSAAKQSELRTLAQLHGAVVTQLRLGAMVIELHQRQGWPPVWSVRVGALSLDRTGQWVPTDGVRIEGFGTADSAIAAAAIAPVTDGIAAGGAA